MRGSQPQDDVHSFVVRIWYEADEGQPELAWRGSVDHVSSGRRIYFHDLDTFVRFVQEHARLCGGSDLPEVSRELGEHETG